MSDRLGTAGLTDGTQRVAVLGRFDTDVLLVATVGAVTDEFGLTGVGRRAERERDDALSARVRAELPLAGSETDRLPGGDVDVAVLGFERRGAVEYVEQFFLSGVAVMTSSAPFTARFPPWESQPV